MAYSGDGLNSSETAVRAREINGDSLSGTEAAADVDPSKLSPVIPAPSNPRDTNLKIFRATRPEEILEIRDIALEFHAESRYAHIPFSEKKFIRAFSKGISNPHDTLAIYVKYQGKTVGMLNAGAGDYYLGEGGRMVTVYVMYVSKSIRDTMLGGKVGLKLMRYKFRGQFAYARVSGRLHARQTVPETEQSAEEVHIHSTSGIDPERADKYLTRLGFKTYGGNYAVRVG